MRATRPLREEAERRSNGSQPYGTIPWLAPLAGPQGLARPARRARVTPRPHLLLQALSQVPFARRWLRPDSSHRDAAVARGTLQGGGRSLARAEEQRPRGEEP
jgi:hypothetical protein